MMSGFLLFDRMRNCSESEKINLLQRQELRLLQMLLFWMIPYFLVYDIWWIKEGDILVNIVEYLRHVLFGGDYFFLWYFVSLMVALVLCYYVRKMPTTLSVSVCVALFIIGAIGSSYTWILAGTGIDCIINKYNSIFTTTRNGLFFGLPCVYIGSVLAYYKEKLSNHILSRYVSFSAILLFGLEMSIYRRLDIKYGVMQVSIIFLAFAAVISFLNIEVSLKEYSFIMRKLSVLVYVIRPLLIICIAYFAIWAGLLLVFVLVGTDSYGISDLIKHYLHGLQTGIIEV